ncbi:MAG: hypothetical protein IJM09_04075 [Neisseriaceae bacterium]|nr:hypothetical protein [Neisseriaceae bacterium]
MKNTPKDDNDKASVRWATSYPRCFHFSGSLNAFYSQFRPKVGKAVKPQTV